MNQYPEHEKVSAARARGSEEVGAFLDWLRARYTLAEWPDGSEILQPCNPSNSNLLYEYFGIDYEALEAEKQAMLEEMRG